MPEDAKSAMARELCQRARQLQAQGDFEMAVEMLRRSIGLEASAEAHRALAWSYNRQGRQAEAIAECKRAIELDPARGDAYNDMGAYLIEMGRPEDAVQYLEMATMSGGYSSHECAWFNLGRAYAAQEMFGKARECFMTALDIEPGYKVAGEALERVRRLIQ